MHTLRVLCHPRDRDAVSAELYGLGTLGIRESEVIEDSRIELEAWFEEPVDAPSLADYDPLWRPAPEVDWVEESRRDWQPLAVGKRLWLVPDWIAGPAPEGRLRVSIHPGAASGSGYSDPTQLALEALESHLREDDTVLDAGTGSGILTAAAFALGARSLIACDIDPDAAHAAASNFRADGIGARCFAGSPRSLRSGCVPLVIANLNAVALLANATELARVLTSSGRLIVTGFRERRERDIRRAFESRGLIVRGALGRNGWRLLALSAVP